MPHWPSKTEASSLVKYITSISVSYNPYRTDVPSSHVRGVREFYKRFQSPTLTTSNPSLKLKHDVHNKTWLPKGGDIKVKFVNGEEIFKEGYTGKVEQVLEEVWRKAEGVKMEVDPDVF